MISIIYTLPITDKDSEMEWLREQKIFPSTQDSWDWDKDVAVVKFGMIISPEAALAVKLRHKLDLQTPYRKK